MIDDWRKNVMITPITEGENIYLFFHNDKWYISTKKGIFNTSTKLYQTIIKLLNLKCSLSQLNSKLCYTFILVTTPYQKLYLTNCFKIVNKDNCQTEIENINIGLFKNKIPLIKILYNFSNIEEIYDYLNVLKKHQQEHMLKGFILKYESYQCNVLTITNKNIQKSPLSQQTISKHISQKIIKELQRYYHSYFVKKTINFSKVPMKYKKHCNNLHKDFIYKLIPENYVSRDIVKKYLNYLSNYEKRLLLKSSKVDFRPLTNLTQKSSEDQV